MTNLIKEYKTAEELVTILESRGLIFSRPIAAKKKLNEINYFFLKGYQKLLVLPEDEKKYKDNCDFEELLNLYSFDKELKGLLLKYLLDIEQKIKSAISNVISSRYGVDNNIYLNRNNFDISTPYVDSMITDVRSQLNSYGQRNVAVKYYLDTYGYVPFYVLSKCLTIGAIKKVFNVMKQVDQTSVCNLLLFRDIQSKRITRTKQMIALIADVRNMCAHDEIVFNFVHGANDIGILNEHAYFNLNKTKEGNLTQGKKDLFALLISMKYMMNRTDYNKLIQELDSLITKTSKKSKVYSREELIKEMHLPLDFVRIRQI